MIKSLLNYPQKAKLIGKKEPDYFLKNYISDVFQNRLKKILQNV